MEWAAPGSAGVTAPGGVPTKSRHGPQPRAVALRARSGHGLPPAAPRFRPAQSAPAVPGAALRMRPLGAAPPPGRRAVLPRARAGTWRRRRGRAGRAGWLARGGSGSRPPSLPPFSPPFLRSRPLRSSSGGRGGPPAPPRRAWRPRALRGCPSCGWARGCGPGWRSRCGCRACSSSTPSSTRPRCRAVP